MDVGIFIRSRSRLQFWLLTPPALLILVDYPDFNLWLAKSAKKLGIPVFYYVSPQIWAWRRGRVHTIQQPRSLFFMRISCVTIARRPCKSIPTQHTL